MINDQGKEIRSEFNTQSQYRHKPQHESHADEQSFRPQPKSKTNVPDESNSCRTMPRPKSQYSKNVFLSHNRHFTISLTHMKMPSDSNSLSFIEINPYFYVTPSPLEVLLARINTENLKTTSFGVQHHTSFIREKSTAISCICTQQLCAADGTNY